MRNGMNLKRDLEVCPVSHLRSPGTIHKTCNLLKGWTFQILTKQMDVREIFYKKIVRLHKLYDE